VQNSKIAKGKTMGKEKAPATIWSGHLSFGLVTIPVRLHSGARAEHLSFNQLHDECMGRINQQLYCKTCERTVERTSLLKGYEHRKGEYITLTEGEIKQVEPHTAGTMEVIAFVPASQVDPIYFESSYFISPQDGGQKGYSLILAAMQQSDRYAIAKVTMHNREHTVAIRPYREGLIVHTLYLADEVRAFLYPALPEASNELELTACHQLMDALSEDFIPETFTDTYQENLRGLIKSKIEGKEPEAPAPKIATMPPPNILDAIRASVELAKKRKAA
jgi:DNA end-binding protein Ku